MRLINMSPGVGHRTPKTIDEIKRDKDFPKIEIPVGPELFLDLVVENNEMPHSIKGYKSDLLIAGLLDGSEVYFMLSDRKDVDRFYELLEELNPDDFPNLNSVLAKRETPPNYFTNGYDDEPIDSIMQNKEP